MNRIYVVSKIKHALMWQSLRKAGEPIISSWIDDGDEVGIDFAAAWPRYLQEAASATHVAVHIDRDEELKGGLFEIGAALGGGADVLISGVPPEQMLRTLIHHPKVRQVESPWEAFEIIRREGKLVGRPGERDPDFPCVVFTPKQGCTERVIPNCDGDGHYMCGECVFHLPSEDADA